MSREEFLPATGAVIAAAESGGGLPGVAIPASVVLQFVAGPAALWSGEPESGALNAAAAAVFGFAEADFRIDGGLWLEHVEPNDRDSYEAFRRRLRQSSGPASWRYRFLPRGTARAVELRETAVGFTSADGAPSILSRYATVAGARFAHKLGNHLQAIRGEIDLLRLSGALPQGAAESIAGSIEAIHRLADEMEKS